MISTAEEPTLDEVLDHARSSRWRGNLVSATHRGRVRTPTCGDEVALEFLIRDGRVREARFQATGCFLCQAGASLVCERSLNQSLDSLQQLSAAELLPLSWKQFSVNRQRCFLLGYEAFRRLSTFGNAE